MDLNKERVADRMSGVVLPPRQPQQIEADRAVRKAADKQARKLTERLLREDGGKDGMVQTRARVRVSIARSAMQTIRCKPGTFEWRYGRNKQDVFFHAGSQLAILWERAGATVASSADFLRGIKSGYQTGITDGRVAAIDKLLGAHDSIGKYSFDRLVDYCVRGHTVSEIAAKNSSRQRDMAAVLHSDLKSCAVHFKFLRA